MAKVYAHFRLPMRNGLVVMPGEDGDGVDVIEHCYHKVTALKLASAVRAALAEFEREIEEMDDLQLSPLAQQLVEVASKATDEIVERAR